MAIHGENGIDRLVEFEARGSATDLHQALSAAHFSGPTAPGTAGQPIGVGVGAAKLRNLRSAQDRWTDVDGDQVNRTVLLGTDADAGVEVLHVWAFTT